MGVAAMAASAALVFSGCASGADAGSAELSDEPVTLRFTWWGNDVRTANTEAVIAAFEAENPNITIEPQFTDWNGYWDKLATETAANDTPDIIQMDEKYITTYAGNGALLDLNDLGDQLDLSDFPKTAIDLGSVDGGLYGIPVALNAMSIVANETLLEKAGVALPDDETWTWDDLKEAGAAVSAAGGGSYYGIQSWAFEDSSLKAWARQLGDDIYNKKGEVVVKPETLASYWEFLLDLTESGVNPPADASIEAKNAGQSGSYTATNGAAFGTWWNNQLTGLADASGSDMKLLKLPAMENAEEGWTTYKSSMYWSVSARTEHPAESALFLDFMLNSEEAADLLGAERGIPANEKIRAYITPKLSDTDQEVAAYIDAVAESVGDAPPLTPPGASAIEALIMQHSEQVFFGQETVDEAAEGFIKDLKAAVAAG